MNFVDYRKKLGIKNLLLLARLEAKFILDSVTVADYSRVDNCTLGDGIVYDQILNENKSNIRDAILADTAVNNGLTLLTNDVRLYDKMKKYSYNVLNVNELKIMLLS